MKYIIFKKEYLLMPIIFNETINHCDVKIGEGFIPVSAGFCFKRDNSILIDKTRLGSESLGIKVFNVVEDQRFLRLSEEGYPISLLLDFDGIYENAPQGYQQPLHKCDSCGGSFPRLEMFGQHGTGKIFCKNCWNEIRKKQ